MNILPGFVPSRAPRIDLGICAALLVSLVVVLVTRSGIEQADRDMSQAHEARFRCLGEAMAGVPACARRVDPNGSAACEPAIAQCRARGLDAAAGAANAAWNRWWVVSSAARWTATALVLTLLLRLSARLWSVWRARPKAR